MALPNDSENLLASGQAENTDSKTDKNPEVRPAEEAREESESPQVSPGDGPEKESTEESKEESTEESKTESSEESKTESSEASDDDGIEKDAGAEAEGIGNDVTVTDDTGEDGIGNDVKGTGGTGDDVTDKDVTDNNDTDDDNFDEDYEDEDYEDYDEDDESYDEDEEDDSEDDSDDDYDEDPDDDESDEGGMGLNLFTFFVLLLAASITAIYFTCTVKTVHVRGNSLYTSEEIAEQVISDDSQLMHNSVFLTLLYMTPKAPRIPFEESVKVSLNSYDTITITVKDMDIAGFIPYAGKNLYFSADGIVLENSPLTVKDATFVTGLSVTGAEIGTKMTADDEVGLSKVLEVLQILRKFQIRTDCVVLTESGSVVMYMGEIKVILGRSDFELKISKIAQILPYLEGRSGTINMTNYTSSDQNIILK